MDKLSKNGGQEDIIGQNLLADEGVEAQESLPVIEPAQTQETQRRLPLKKIAVSGGIALIILLLLLVPLIGVVRAATNISGRIQKINDSFKNQNIGAVKNGVSALKGDIEGFDRSLTPLTWIRILPFLGGYWEDAKNGAAGGKAAVEALELLIPAIEPYADVLGFNSEAPPTADGAKTAEERIDFIVATLPEVLPKLDPVGEKLKVADEAIGKIDAHRYPEELGGKKIRDTITDSQAAIKTIKTFVTDGKPLLASLPYLLGIPEERAYLVIFQNDKELRPTGGFMTAYSLMKVKEGRIQPVSSDDIYNLDKRYKADIEAPKPFLEHIKQPYSANPNWRIRDMNWSADFREAMDFFYKEAKTAKLPEVDGIISVDTNVLVYLLQITGQIGVPGQGNFSADIDARCGCPQVIYELESYADVEKPIVWDPNTGKIVFGEIVDNRKAILGPLVNSVIANSLAQPKEKVPQLAGAVLRSLQEKNVMVYVFDQDTQRAVESFNIAGRLRETQGDYLAIVDANLGGRKSNLYVTQDVGDEIKVTNDKITHELTITYKNPQKHDGWLNSVLPNYMRVYVPRGAKLVDAQGLSAEMQTSEESGKTVFGGFFELRPEGVVKVSIKYEVANTGAKGSPYTLLVRKQPGTVPFHYSMKANGKTEEFQLGTDKELKF